jgi:hypothetical protein
MLYGYKLTGSIPAEREKLSLDEDGCAEGLFDKK